ncbi:sigma-70 family RNA polymerase sigma factor [Flocculibacter collagenilyticus]|uniref:sigma-70 family RNA polymerase sigma factor n=1 Tax=Flocculibacter collagenilyticus TaxID=2744479 RepID=UPI0018F51830|nr:sigma-70 family RNA polymerase sigma factor [Flocculibacter collagenilyticus]
MDAVLISAESPAESPILISEQISTSPQELFNQNYQWAKSVAYNMFAMYKVDGVDSEDFVQYALIGLLESCNNYDSTINVPFKLYAIKRLRGEILNNILRFSEKAYANNIYNKLVKERITLSENQTRQHNEPTSLIVETILDLAVGFLLEESVDENNSSELCGVDLTSPELKTMTSRIYGLVNSLPDTLKKVIKLHYLEYKSFTEIAVLLNLSLGRISQAHSQAIFILRKKLRW